MSRTSSNKMIEEYPRIAVAVPQERTLSNAPKAFPAFWHIAQRGYDLLAVDYAPVEVARNFIAIELLKSEAYTHVVMLDADHIHPENIVEAYKSIIMQDPDKYQVIGGLNFRRSAPYFPCIFKETDDPDVPVPVELSSLKQNALMEVDYIGSGSLCVDRRVFESIKPPWFIKQYDHFYDKFALPGEDILFSRMCRENGIKIWAHTGIISPHMDVKYIGARKCLHYEKYGEALGDSPFNC